MIPKYLAVKFLEALTEKLGYNINIIDENGMIIASSDKNRADTFHEGAYKLMKENQEIVRISREDKNYLGVKPGVNLPVRYNNEVIGVGGVTGNPDEVQAVAYAIKTSLETMIEYEFYKDSVFLRQSKKNIFVNMLLYEKDCDVKAIENMASYLDYSFGLYRAPIIIAVRGNLSSEELLTLAKQSDLHSSQDISCVTNDRNILIFKVVRIGKKGLLEDYRQQSGAYIRKLVNMVKARNIPLQCRFYVGSFEKKMTRYRTAYEQAHWCLDFVECTDGEAVFFIDHVEDYLLARIPRIEYVNVFESVQAIMTNLDKDMTLLATVRAVYDSGMNLQKAAEALGVHRNTVYQRLRKLSELLGFDPFGDFCRNSFLYYLSRSVPEKGR